MIISEGQIVWNHGYQFIARNVTIANGILRYTGVCTNHPANDLIRNTGYNGARYGWKVTDTN